MIDHEIYSKTNGYFGEEHFYCLLNCSWGSEVHFLCYIYLSLKCCIEWYLTAVYLSERENVHKISYKQLTVTKLQEAVGWQCDDQKAICLFLSGAKNQDLSLINWNVIQQLSEIPISQHWAADNSKWFASMEKKIVMKAWASGPQLK